MSNYNISTKNPANFLYFDCYLPNFTDGILRLGNQEVSANPIGVYKIKLDMTNANRGYKTT